MKRKVGIIGHFGANEDRYDGQTIKTKNLEMLLGKIEDISLMKVDTYYFRKNKLKLLLDTLWCMLTCKHIFLMVSVNGMRFYLPFLHYLNKVTHRQIYHYVIGSELLKMVSDNPKLVKYLNSLTENWFEYDSGTKYLKAQGVNNVLTLPNFKLITPVDEPVEYDESKSAFRFCTFSRVMEEKGITEAIEAVSAINKEQGKIIARLDIYGQIEANYADKLNELLLLNAECVSYQGTVDSKASADVLKDYYALLFPTKWDGEGFPGTIIDAFAAGIPIIATDWNANKEIIRHGRQGVIYPNDEMVTLKDAMNYSIKNTAKIKSMRVESRKAFAQYSPDTVLQAILKRIN